jgi:GTP-binding protein
MLNVYQLQLGRGEKGEVPSGTGRAPEAHRHEPLPSPLSLYLLDLPGYGYSRASQSDRRAFRLLISHAMGRPRLAGVLWLLDMRREPSADDRAMQELFAERETRVLAALTKSDKQSRTERPRRESELREALGLDEDQVIVTSAREGTGIEDLRESIGQLVRPAS